MPAPKKSAKKTATGKIAKPRKAPRPKQIKDVTISAEERQQMIGEAAYFLAEQRKFSPGAELDDWLRAEAQINDNPAC